MRYSAILMFLVLLTSCYESGNNSQSGSSSDKTEDSKPIPTLDILDPLYAEQWYIHNDGKKDGRKKGIDLNLLPVWQQGYKGIGISVGVVDKTFDSNHPDLKDNFPAKNYLIKDANVKCDAHGTNVMGIIAARDNSIGIRGIAPRATLYGYEVTSDIMPRVFNWDVREEYIKKIAVYNGSIGAVGADYIYDLMPDSLESAFDTAINKGFGGLGASLVFAAENLVFGGNASNSLYTNHYGVMGINAILGSGEWKNTFPVPGHSVGTNIWVTAPTNGITTSHTKCSGVSGKDYAMLGGTSGATPMVSGVVALLRGAYPKLGWRDVKLIIAESARKILPDKEGYKATGYEASGRMYHDSTKQQKYHRLSGFGLVDAGAAFNLAKNWDILPPMKTEDYSSDVSFDTSDIKVTYKRAINVATSAIGFIESVTLEIDFDVYSDEQAWFMGDLSLTSPDKKVAKFYASVGDNSLLESAFFGKTRKLLLLSNRFLGSDRIDGEWVLALKQDSSIVISRVNSWRFTLRGH